MPKISHAGSSNWEPQELGQERDDLSSAGINFSTSESKQDKSGTSSMTGPQSPAKDAESLSGKDLLKNQGSSSASSTAGSGQGTTSGQRNQSSSSAASQAGGQATQGQGTKSQPKRAGSS